MQNATPGDAESAADDEPAFDVPKQLAYMTEALKDGRIDESEALYDALCAALPEAREWLVFPVLFAIQRGQLGDALLLVNQQPEERCPELKALCLHLLGDPSWHGLAESLEDDPEPAVRLAMRELLGRDTEGDSDAAPTPLSA